MAIEFVQLNAATTTGARIAGDVVTGATPSDNVYYQTVQLVKGGDGAAKSLVTSGDGLPVVIDALATVALGAGTATVGSFLIGAGTATGGSVHVSETTATYVLGAGTATIGSVNLTSPSGNSLTTDGVLLTQLAPGSAAIGTVQVTQTTATTVLGAGTATIGSVNLSSPSGNSLTTDGILLAQLAPGSAAIGTVQITQTTATTVLGPGTASIGNVHLTENTATLVLSAGTASIGFVGLSSGTATVGTVHAVIDGYGVGTATGGRIVPKFASISFTASDANSTATIVAGVAGAKIRPLSYVLVAQGTLNIQWTSATTVNLSGFMALASQTGIAANFNPYGHMETTTGQLLGIRGSATGITVAGHVTYIEATT